MASFFWDKDLTVQSAHAFRKCALHRLWPRFSRQEGFFMIWVQIDTSMYGCMYVCYVGYVCYVCYVCMYVWMYVCM